MAYDESSYRNWYARQNYDRISMFVPKGSRVMIQQAARAEGQSMNAYLVSLIPKSLIVERDYKRESDQR